MQKASQAEASIWTKKIKVTEFQNTEICFVQDKTIISIAVKWPFFSPLLLQTTNKPFKPKQYKTVHVLICVAPTSHNQDHLFLSFLSSSDQIPQLCTFYQHARRLVWVRTEQLFVEKTDIQANSPDPGKCSRYRPTENNAGVTVFFHGALRPQKTYGLLGTGENGTGNENPGLPPCSHSSWPLTPQTRGGLA